MGDRSIGEALGSDFAIIHPATWTEGPFVRRAHWGSPVAALIRLAVRYGSKIPQIHSGRRKNQPSRAKAMPSVGTCQGWWKRDRGLSANVVARGCFRRSSVIVSEFSSLQRDAEWGRKIIGYRPPATNREDDGKGRGSTAVSPFCFFGPNLGGKGRRVNSLPPT